MYKIFRHSLYRMDKCSSALLLVLLGLAVVPHHAVEPFSFHIGPCLVVHGRTCSDNNLVKFYLFTRSNRDEGKLLDFDHISLSMFEGSRPTKIIVHGFTESKDYYSFVDIKNGYLNIGDYNVILTDWSILARGPELCYPTAKYNNHHVGVCLATLVQRLIEASPASAGHLHVVGASMGAHIAGFAANHLKPYRLPRITGLEPALPLYITADNDNKLDASDAEFVDVVHTNLFFLGKIEQCGHADFYINGGTIQPGCDTYNQNFTIYCSHKRVVDLFAESITSSKGFWGWNCSGIRAYLLGLCPPRSPAILMGEHVSHSARGVIRVNTASSTPFALGPWLLDARLSDVELPWFLVDNTNDITNFALVIY